MSGPPPPPPAPYPPPPSVYSPPPPMAPPGYPPPPMYYTPMPQPAPPEPPGRRRNILIVVLVVAAVLVASVTLGFYYLIINAPTHAITVTNANWTISSLGIYNGYFGPTSFNSCGSCPIHVGNLAQFQLQIPLRNINATFAHNVTSVSVYYPFSVVSVIPATPISVAPGASVTITLTIQTYTVSVGSYVLTGTIGTS